MRPRPDIVHVVHSLATGGLENGVVNLVNTTGDRFRHAIVCMTTAGSLRDRLRPSVEVFEVHKRPGHDMLAFVRLIRLLKHLGPSIVHSRNWATFDAILAARIAGIARVVHGEHGRDISDPEGRNARRNRVRRLLAPFVSRFVTVSDDLRRWLVDWVRLPAEKVVTIHNGVDLGRFASLDRTDAREQVGLPASAVVVGTVGRLDPVKDQAGLIEAFGAVVRTHPDVCLAIVGDGPCRDELTALVAGLSLEKHVYLLGERRDIPVVLSAMDCFVLPSIAEGISNTILEAMAVGLPVVGTRVGGTPELVDDGVTGRLVPALDVTALAAAIESYVADPSLRRHHGQAGRQRAIEQFDLERMSRAYTYLYAQLIPGRPGEEVETCAE